MVLFDKNFLILLGAVSVAALLGVFVYDLVIRSWVKRWKRRLRRKWERRRGW